MRPIYIVLLHHPIQNRKGETVTTAVTNMDVHDISRTCRTYGADRFFIVTPILDQHELIGRILSHWQTEKSRTYHPDRVEALDRVLLVKDFEEVKAKIMNDTGSLPEVYMPDARPIPGALSYRELRAQNNTNPLPLVLVFGTGWGVAKEFYAEVTHFLEPILGAKPKKETEKEYNHLSVRSAVAIIMDRLFGIE